MNNGVKMTITILLEVMIPYSAKMGGHNKCYEG